MNSTNFFGENTLRDVMKDRLRSVLAERFDLKEYFDIINELVCDLADEVFSVCGISEKEQDERW